MTHPRTTTFAPNPRRRLLRLAVVGSLLAGALWLGGCSTHSYFSYRESWSSGRYHSYHRERWRDDCDYRRDYHHDYGHHDRRW